MPRAAARHLLALGVFAVAALILTWPLAPHMATHVPGDGIDDPALAWNLWWIKSRLVDHAIAGIFASDWMFHPIGVNLAFYTLTPLNGLLSIPLQTGLQLVLASNLLLLSSFVLGAYGVFLLALHVQSKPPLATATPRSSALVTGVALFAGLAYAFAAPKLFYAALGQFNIASSQWIPFAALYVLRIGDSRSTRAAVRNGALAGLFLVMQAWAELTYASFLLIFYALYALWWLIACTRSRRTEQTGPHWTAFFAGVIASAAVFAVGVAPFLVAMAHDLLAEGDFFASGGGFSDVFSADLMGYLVPTRLHPVFGALAAGLPFPNDKGQHIYLGYLTLILCAAGVYGYGLRTKPRRQNIVWFWVSAALVFWLFTLGPHLRWAGQDLPIPGPFALVSRLPFFSGNRYPSRYSVMLLLSTAVLSVYGLRYVVARVAAARSRGTLRPRTVSVVLAVAAALMFFEHLSTPLPLSDFRTPAVYEELATQPGDFTVLELPTGWRNGARVMGRSDVLIMMQQWYQTTHGKRRLGGNTSRNPPLKFQYFTDAPLLGELIALMNADRPHIAAVIEPQFDALSAQGRQAAPHVLDFLGVDYVLLHEERSPAALIRFVEEALPVELVNTWEGADWTGAPSTIRLYRATPSEPARSWEADLAAPAGKLHIAEGWSELDATGWPVRFATRRLSALLLDLPDAGGVLELETAGIADAVRLQLNGRWLETPKPDADGTVTVMIPPGAGDELVDRLVIEWKGKPASIAEVGALWNPARPIGTTGADLAEGVAVAARSAGEEVGDFAHLYVNGVDHAPNERGYNLVALTRDGDVLGARAFDTHADAEASEAMAAWIEQWPAGTVIAGAVADEAGLNLQQAGVDALAALGAGTDLRDKFRWSHAFVGVVGAGPGTALEAAGLIRPADAVIGPPLDAPAAYGGVGDILFRDTE